MPLEDNINEGSTPSDLNPLWPLGEDPKSEGDDHIRNMKRVMLNLYNALSFADLPVGAIPAIFDGVLDDSGTRVINGGWEFTVPVNFRNLFLHDPRTDLRCPIPFTPLGGNQRPVHLKSANLVNVVRQPVDTETNNNPIDYIFESATSEITKAFMVKGAGSTIPNVRVTIHDVDASGAVIARTATDAELRAGGGFTINATGLTTITLPQLWVGYSGDISHVELDRYDPLTDAIVTTGITLKGATILGQFIPYFEQTSYNYTLVELQEAGGGINRIGKNLTEGQGNIGVATSLNSFSIPAESGVTYEWEITVAASFLVGNDAYAAIQLSVDGTSITLPGESSLGEIASRATGRVRSYTFKGEYDATVTGSVPVEVVAEIGSGTIDAIQSIITFNQVS